jgi:hypothetical protein
VSRTSESGSEPCCLLIPAVTVIKGNMLPERSSAWLGLVDLEGCDLTLETSLEGLFGRSEANVSVD